MKQILTILLFVLVLLTVGIVLLFGHRDIPLEELKAKYAQAPSQFIEVDGMDVHFRDEGNPNDSIPIVLIHGIGSSLHTFDDWTSALSHDYRVIRMDLPAHGLTGPFPDRDYAMNHYVDFIKNFLKQTGVDRCILGGNSLGGQISWRFTLANPDQVEKLILIDAAGYPFNAKSIPIAFKLARMPIIKNVFTYITPKSVARSSIENVYADPIKVTDALADRYFELTLRAGNRQAFIDRISMAVVDPDPYERIPDIFQPTLVLWGDQDLLIPLEFAQRFHQDLPNDTLVILENVGHVPMEEVPERSLAPVLSFLEK